MSTYTVREVARLEWDALVQDCHHANLLQSWQYGVAKEQTGSWRAVRLVVRDASSDAVGLAQILVRDLPVVGGIARLNRGPLLVGTPDESRENVALNIIAAILDECVRRRWWVVQIAPDVADSAAAAATLESFGLRKVATAAWASGLVSLEPPEDELMMTLNGKWRNCLRKGLRLPVLVRTADASSSELGPLLEMYGQVQTDRRFSGLPDSLITALAHQRGDAWSMNLFVAEQDGSEAGERVGMVVSIRHGDTSTYMVGATTDKGRELQANYVLLWHAIREAKRAGCQWFDIGGVNETTPAGVAHFKGGLNADPYTLVGEWRRVAMPWTSALAGSPEKR